MLKRAFQELHSQKGATQGERTSRELYVLVCCGAGALRTPGQTWLGAESPAEFLVPGAAGSLQGQAFDADTEPHYFFVVFPFCLLFLKSAVRGDQEQCFQMCPAPWHEAVTLTG